MWAWQGWSERGRDGVGVAGMKWAWQGWSGRVIGLEWAWLRVGVGGVMIHVEDGLISYLYNASNSV